MPSHYTSLISLKPEFAERYMVLHKHTFPGVLDRIAKSNICNYSIFLHDNLLFSHYEYHGEDYDGDMSQMGDDVTRDWWKLTDAMQEPLPTRDEGEWWAATRQLFTWENVRSGREDVRRHAFKCAIGGDSAAWGTLLSVALQSQAARWTKEYNAVSLSSKDSCLYLYVEDTAGRDTRNIEALQASICQLIHAGDASETGFIEMKEVFYTDKKKEEMSAKKVFVTGCFDMLHSGHVAFLQEAATYGDLYVSIGSDENVFQLKGRYPVNTQAERIYMMSSVKYVKQCTVNSGFGIMDFLNEVEHVKPDIFVVNEDGNTPAKADFCKEKGIEYKVLKRIPHDDLPRRSTTDLRKECVIPYRIDLAGGWIDQPWVSKLYPGPVLTISIEPTIEFNHRSGMSTSTRLKAIELWKTELPRGDREQLAKVLFTFENPPGTQHISGSQDALGIVMPCLNKLNYNGEYWPSSIESRSDEDILQWIENSLYLIPLGPRKSHYNVLDNTNITREGAAALSQAAENCWKAILDKNIKEFGKFVRASFEAQIAMFPNMADQEIFDTIEHYRDKVAGWKLSGAGGGGYLIFVAEEPLENALRIRIRRGND